VQSPLPSTDLETIPTTTTSSDNISVPLVNGTELPSSPTTSNKNVPATSPSLSVPLTNTDEASLSSTIPPPPPPSSSSAATIPTAKTPAIAVANTIPLTHSAAAVQAAYRQQSSLLGALPTAAALRAAQGAVYAATPGLSNGLGGQILYGGK
jgi:hypothetical protein